MYSNTILVSLCLIYTCCFIAGYMPDGAESSEDYATLTRRLKSNERITQKLTGSIDALKSGEIRLHEKLSTLEARESEYLKRLSNLEVHDSELHDTIDDLKTQMSNIQTRLDATELRESALADQVMKLEKKNKEQSTLINRLQKQIVKQHSIMALLVKQSRLHFPTVTEHNPEVDDNTAVDETNQVKHKESADTIITKINGKRLNRVQKSEHDLSVAFFATMGASMSHIGTNQPIIFENAVTNVGYAYNKHLGAFIAPVSGIYVFSTTLHSGRGVTFSAGFVHNDQHIAYLGLHGAELHAHASGSKTIILQLQKGDIVSVRNFTPDISIYGSSYSTFAGFLLQADNKNPAIVG